MLYFDRQRTLRYAAAGAKRFSSWEKSLFLCASETPLQVSRNDRVSNSYPRRLARSDCPKESESHRWGGVGVSAPTIALGKRMMRAPENEVRWTRWRMGGVDAACGGARRAEEKSATRNALFLPALEAQCGPEKNQRPGLWNISAPASTRGQAFGYSASLDRLARLAVHPQGKNPSCAVFREGNARWSCARFDCGDRPTPCKLRPGEKRSADVPYEVPGSAVP